MSYRPPQSPTPTVHSNSKSNMAARINDRELITLACPNKTPASANRAKAFAKFKIALFQDCSLTPQSPFLFHFYNSRDSKGKFSPCSMFTHLLYVTLRNRSMGLILVYSTRVVVLPVPWKQKLHQGFIEKYSSNVVRNKRAKLSLKQCGQEFKEMCWILWCEVLALHHASHWICSCLS